MHFLQRRCIFYFRLLLREMIIGSLRVNIELRKALIEPRKLLIELREPLIELRKLLIELRKLLIGNKIGNFLR
jgi:hypothetical protein